MNNLRFFLYCFLFLAIPFVSNAQENQKKNYDKGVVLSDSLVKAQLWVADSLIGIDASEAHRILTFLLKNQIQDKILWEKAVNLSQKRFAWLGQDKQAIRFLDSIISNGNPNPKIYLWLSKEYQFLFDYSKAISNAQTAILLSTGINDLEAKVNAVKLLIELYGSIGMFEEAKQYFISNLELSTKNNYVEGIVLTYLTYGEALVYENPAQAVEYFNKAIEIINNEDISLTSLMSEAYTYLVRFYINSNQLDLAKKEVRNYLEAGNFPNHVRDSNVLTLMAHIFYLENNVDSTIYYNRKALELRILSGNEIMTASSYLNLAGNYLIKNEIETANKYLEKAKTELVESNNLGMLLTYYRGKVKYTEYIKDYKNAYLFSQKEIELSKELNNLQHQSALSKLNTSFEIQQENILLAKELDERKAERRLTILVLASLLFFLVAGYFIYLYRKKNYFYLKLVNEASDIKRKLIISNKERFKFQSVFEYSVTGILILNKEGLVQYANHKSKKIFGIANDDAILQFPFVGFFDGDHKTGLQEILSNVINQNQAEKGIKVKLTHQKNFHWLDISFAPLVFEQEEDAILVTLIDVTQEVINIGMEQKQRQELQTLLNSVTESILFIQRDGNIQALNNTAASRLDLNYEELIGANYFNVIPESLRNKRIKMFDKVVLTKKPLIELEMMGNYNNLVSMYPNIDLNGEVDYVSEFVQDITERRMAEEQIDNLKQSVLRSQMNPHFIFNSLASIQGFVIRNEASMASKYLNSFARLIRLILESSRHDFISLKNEIDILNYYLDIQKMRFSDNFTYTFEIDPDLDLDKIKVPPMLAQPFIENSIEHGIQHLEKMGVLNLRFVKDNSRLLFEIRDNGIGREASYELNRENIFASKSLSTKIINDRLNALNKSAKDAISYNIIDLKDELNQSTGTQVIISIPIRIF